MTEILVESLLEEKLADKVENRLESVLPGVVTDYLDLLLRGGTEFLERHWDHFRCLRFQAGGHNLLVPLDRIKRIDKLSKYDNQDGLRIPDCDGEENLVLSLHQSKNSLYIQSVLDIVEVQHEEVMWREVNALAPWFVGTHKTYLCRLFDPKFLVQS